jgi:hypothetical protein
MEMRQRQGGRLRFVVAPPDPAKWEWLWFSFFATQAGLADGLSRFTAADKEEDERRQQQQRRGTGNAGRERGVESALVANLATLVGLGVVWCEKPILGKTVGWGGRGGGGGAAALQQRTPQKQKPKEKKKKKTKPNQTKPFVPTSTNLQKERPPSWTWFFFFLTGRTPTTHPQNKNTKKSFKKFKN